MTNEFYKTAEEHYSFLLNQYKEKLNSEEVEKLAFEVVNKMAENGNITTPEQAIEKIAEYRDKAIEELKILNQALDLGPVEKTAEVPKLGSLSEAPSGDGQDNLTSFLLEDFY